MKKETLLISGGVAAVLTAGVLIWLYFKPTESVIRSFWDCLRVGYPVIDTFPRTCKTSEGQTLIEPVRTPAEFKITDLEEGASLEAQPGDKLTVHYIGQLTNGKIFDSSLDRGLAFSFNLGSGSVIKGWDLGLIGMKVGGIRRLEIPAELAYGNRSIGIIPPNSDLIFEVKLLEVRRQ